MSLTWTFNQFENFIIGKSEKNSGFLQISLAFKSESEKEAENLLLDFADLPENQQIEFEVKEEFEIHYKYFDLMKDNKKLRYWFFVKPEGLILANYSSKNVKFDDEEVKDCEIILLKNTF